MKDYKYIDRRYMLYKEKERKAHNILGGIIAACLFYILYSLFSLF